MSDSINLAMLKSAVERLDLSCQSDPLNPCWNGRPTDVAGRHWGGGRACAACDVRAALAGATKPAGSPSALAVGDVIPAPQPFDGTVEIIGFRLHTSRNNGRTFRVADYVGRREDGSHFQSYDAVDRLMDLKAKATKEAVS